MKRGLRVLCSVVILCWLGSCQETNKGVNVVVSGSGKFPAELAGTWKSSAYGCEFVFEPNGNISSAVIALGEARIRPAMRTVIPTRDGGENTYDSGKWNIQYTPSSRELMVEIVIDRLHLQFGKHFLKGSLREVFTGDVSGDYKEWRATWIRFPKYIAYTPEPHELTADPNDTIEELVFTKVEGKVN